MKTVHIYSEGGSDKYLRLSDKDAKRLVATIPNAHYCKKEEWKKNVRDVDKRKEIV